MTARRTGSAARNAATGSRLRLVGNRARDAGVRRVLGLELGVRADLVHRLRDGDRRLGEARGDELELAVEGRDVAARPHAVERGLHHLVDDDRALDYLKPPVL